jgi:hypothetical protein
MTIELNINNGTITSIIEDAELSLYFWNDYFTPCTLLEEEQEFLIENEVDLMGNSIK